MNLQFATDLERWGPGRATAAASESQSEAYCRSLARRHYENFPLASWMLPRHLHQHFFNVYAYCRWADDLGDEIGDRERSRELLGWWRGELETCYGGSATHPVFVALRKTIERFSIPRQPFEDLISAFEQDQRVTEYETFAQLRDYCRRSADPVGQIVLYVCECFTEENARLSDSICTGLQLANFWQDVARDYDIGRVYLPRESRLQFGYSDEDLEHRRTNEAFIELMRFEVARARHIPVRRFTASRGASRPIADRYRTFCPWRPVDLGPNRADRISCVAEAASRCQARLRPIVCDSARTKPLAADSSPARHVWCTKLGTTNCPA